MKCAECDREIEDWRAECPYCHGKTDSTTNQERSNADYLEIVSKINLAICIISAIIAIAPTIINISDIIDGYETFSWVPIFWSIGLTITGFSIFFLFNTVADIYKKIKK